MVLFPGKEVDGGLALPARHQPLYPGKPRSGEQSHRSGKRLQVGMYRLGVRQAESVKRDGASLLRS